MKPPQRTEMNHLTFSGPINTAPHSTSRGGEQSLRLLAKMRGVASWMAVAELLLPGAALGDDIPRKRQCVWKAGRSCDLTKSNKRLSTRKENLPREECEAACLDIGLPGCCWWAHGSRAGEGCRFGLKVEDCPGGP